jgi:hypothetical protein
MYKGNECLYNSITGTVFVVVKYRCVTPSRPEALYVYMSLSLAKEDKRNVPIILGHTVISMQLLLRTELAKGRKKHL